MVPYLLDNKRSRVISHAFVKRKVTRQEEYFPSEKEWKQNNVTDSTLTLLAPMSSFAKLNALTNMAENPKPSKTAAG